MKRIVSIVLLILLVIGLVGCGGKTAVKNTGISAQDLQGYWYDEDDSGLLMGFKGDSYILYGFVTHMCITGTFEVKDQTLIVYPEGMDEKVYKSAKIENAILSITTLEGEVTKWKNISEEAVKRMLEEDK